MSRDILADVQRLLSEGRPFALATVVAALQPASGTPGARAVIFPDGHVSGWIGGHCAQPAVIRQALEALTEGTPRLVIISPEADGNAAGGSGAVRIAMTCVGQGEIQVFVEPFLPKAQLVVIGSSPVAQTLARFASLLEFEVWACDDHADMEIFPSADRLIPNLEALIPQLSPRSLVVVATIGTYDEEAVAVGLSSSASYVGLVASQRRFAAMLAYLRDQSVDESRIAQLRRPKGTDGQAVLPPEIAFSVMAELLEVRRHTSGVAHEEPVVPRATAIDPICGMEVDVATARYMSERGGQTFYFCGKGCQRAFETPAAEPQPQTNAHKGHQTLGS